LKIVRLIVLIAIVMILALLWVPVVPAQKVQWSGNGHYYEAVSVSSGITWDDANSRANAAGGHLATITNADENQFVYDLIASDDRYWTIDPSFPNNGVGPWIGGYKPGGPESADWAWVTGEPFSYTNWAPGQPDNYKNIEDKLFFYAVGAEKASAWDDSAAGDYSSRPPVQKSYIVEWDTSLASGSTIGSPSTNSGGAASGYTGSLPSSTTGPSTTTAIPGSIANSGSTVSGQGQGVAPQNMVLTGVWSCDDGGTYYIRQLGNMIWWFGEPSMNPDRWSNVARGTISGNTITLEYSDIPKGCAEGYGTLVLEAISNNVLNAKEKPPSYGGSTWTRTASTACPDSMPTSNGSMTSDLIPTTTSSSSSSTTTTSLNQNTLNPWDTPQGQACFENWIRESMSRLNAYNGDKEFNARKPWSINKYGLLQAKGISSVGAPEDFHDHNYNRYWWMWDRYNAPSSTGWEDNNWDGAQVPPIREYVNKCISQGG
jgi:hypothetical protein